MKINELKPGTSGVALRANVVEKSEPREVVTKYGARLNVADITLQDESGKIAMSLWGNDINTVNVGDTVEVSNCYVNEFRGTPQLTTGKFGKITVVGKSSGGKEASDSDEGGDEFPPDAEPEAA